MPKRPAGKSAAKGGGRLGRTLRSLAYICALGIALAVYNAISLRRDIGLAIGPAGPAQEAFFRASSERPDISTFFKNLTPARRLAMAKNIGRYTDPELAKLCGKCLDTFDPAARLALTESLAHVAKVHPDATAALMNLPGSFQQIAIAAALHQAGPSALPLVAKESSDADARPNAIAYLVAAGVAAIQPTLPYLSSPIKDVRLAAADALGKLRAKEALPSLNALYRSSTGEERLEYLTALAGIGDPSSEALMTQTLMAPLLSPPARAQAALGLGTIGTPSSLTTLWRFVDAPDKTVRESTISALQLAGDAALREAPRGEGREAILRVAGGVHTSYADGIIRSALMDPRLGPVAATVAGNRPTLVPDVLAGVRHLDAGTEGDVVDSLLRALATTTEGREALSRLVSQSAGTPVGALAARRLALTRA